MKQIIRKLRRLPSQGHIIPAVGAKVAHDEIIGELDYIPGPLIRHDIARALGIDPQDLDDKMVKQVGDWVDNGEVIAENSIFYSCKQAYSIRGGYMALWSRYMGYAYIREPLPIGAKSAVTIRAEEFGISKLQFSANVRTKLDAVVNTGQMLVSGSKPIVAPSLSRVTTLSMMDGVIVLTPLFQVTEMPALIDGFIAEIPDRDSCVVATMGHRFTGSVGYGEEATGIIKPLLGEVRNLEITDLNDDLAGSIIIARGGVSLEALSHLAEEKIAGLVLGCIEVATLGAFTGRDPLRYLGTLMPIPFPIILMQGYGAPMLAEDYQAIAALAGMRGALDGKTQLRAGVTRPELLVPLPQEPFNLEDPPPDEHPAPLQVGGRALLTRAPYFGQGVLVLALDHQRQETPAGTLAALATVQLADGQILQVPLANCRSLLTSTDKEG